MENNTVQTDARRPSRKARVTTGLIASGGFLMMVFAWMIYTMFRIDVGPDQFAMLICKTGKELKNSEEVAPDEFHKGCRKRCSRPAANFTIRNFMTGKFNRSSRSRPASWA